ncbi:S1C family serine protease [Anaerostipes sp. 494a]|uniref:S1C family serine protease n=1 Tax=Anaerostipes sp. 494a TaxID=1261636 RepID=UPI0009517B82|nr:trypsin-like peptidase domain-containing protein [Anaerostipes sp. 494a]
MSEYNNINNDDQWTTADQWREEEKTEEKKTKKSKESKDGKWWLRICASAVAFGLIAGLVMQGVMFGFSKAGVGSTGTQLATTKTSSSSSSSSSNDLSSVSENVMPSIVSITGKFESTTQGWFGREQSSETEGVGSGIIIGKQNGKLLIVTNNHVVEDAKSLSVGFVDDESASAAIRGTDSDADLAVVEVNVKDMKSSTLKKIAIITLGDSDKLKTGEQAIAIGNALGYGQSVTGGYISALNREVQLTDKTMTLLQTDAAINPGNSGGALLNSKGELIGINTVKYSSEDVEGMGYAIPINTAKPIIDQLIKNEAIDESEQAYLGISGQTIDSSMGSQFDMPSGVYVQQVVQGSPAQKAGISAGDVIVKIAGKSVSTMDGLKDKISNMKAGTSVKIEIKRQNQMGTYKTQTVTVTLGKKADAPSTSNTENN